MPEIGAAIRAIPTTNGDCWRPPLKKVAFEALPLDLLAMTKSIKR
jgi:hypothetical protein